MTCDGHNKGGTNLVDVIIHMVCSPYGILHLFHGSFHLVHLSLQVWYFMSDSASKLVSFSIIISPFVLYILTSFSTMLLMTLSINFSS